MFGGILSMRIPKLAWIMIGIVGLVALPVCLLAFVPNRILRAKYAEILEGSEAKRAIESTSIQGALAQVGIKQWRWEVLSARCIDEDSPHADSIAFYERDGRTRHLFVVWLAAERPVRYLYATRERGSESMPDTALVEEFENALRQRTTQGWYDLLASRGFRPTTAVSSKLLDVEIWVEKRQLVFGTRVNCQEPSILYVNPNAVLATPDRLMDGILRFYIETDPQGTILQRGMFSLSEEGIELGRVIY